MGRLMMTSHVKVDPTGSCRVGMNGQTLVFHELPALTHTARDARENHADGRLTKWLLGGVLVGVLAGAYLYFLAVSPYILRVLGPFFDSH
jgi:hypothetical protein